MAHKPAPWRWTAGGRGRVFAHPSYPLLAHGGSDASLRLVGPPCVLAEIAFAMSTQRSPSQLLTSEDAGLPGLRVRSGLCLYKPTWIEAPPVPGPALPCAVLPRCVLLGRGQGQRCHRWDCISGQWRPHQCRAQPLLLKAGRHVMAAGVGVRWPLAVSHSVQPRPGA